MKRVFAFIFVVCTASVLVAQGPVTQNPIHQRPVTTSSGVHSVSGAEAEKSKAGAVEEYIVRALELCRRAQETGELSLYSQADDAIRQALKLDPNNFEAQKVRVTVALSRHEFAAARDLATVLNKRVPDDVSVYGRLVDADLALGNYDEAERAAQWMLNLRPGNVPALIRTAQLREIFGDPEGVIEVLQMILDSSGPADVENRRWALTQMARIEIATGKLDFAETAVAQALALEPDSADSLRTAARLRMAQHRSADAVEYLRRAYKASPQPETLYELAEAMEAAGLKDDSKRAFADFEGEALARSASPLNCNRDLVFYYADHAKRPADALRIAQLEISRRHDVLTLDAYAWALYANGQYADARKQVEAALKPGVRDAAIFRHASQIALKLNDRQEAERYERLASELEPPPATPQPKGSQIASR